MCVCVCASRILRHGVFLYVLRVINTRHPRLAALEELTPCVDVLCRCIQPGIFPAQASVQV